MSFVRGANPIWWIPDLTGKSLNDEYYAFFYYNDNPTVFAPMYADKTGLILRANPVEFLPSGTMPIDLYFDPNIVYRIEIRHGNQQISALVWEVNDYIPSQAESINTNTIFDSDNLITNPQFVDILFQNDLVIDTAGTYEIAPGWFFLVTGTGNTTITQNAYSGNNSLTADAPYTLGIVSSGWQSCILYQRFSENGALFGGGAIALSATFNNNSSAVQISATYKPSNGLSTQVISAEDLVPGINQFISGVINIPASNSTDIPPNAYVDIIWDLPVSCDIEITNVQLVGQSTPLPAGTFDSPQFIQQSVELERDHEFHYYKNSILLMPKNSLLTGWQFGLNPWQFTSIANTTLASQIDYSADQTLVFQQNGASQISLGQAGFADNLGLQITCVTNTNKFALIQYIDTSTIAPYWKEKLSSLVKGRIITTHGSQVKFKMRLIYRTDIPPVFTATEPILSWGATDNDEPVFQTGWLPIKPIGDPQYTLKSTTDYFSFNSFQMPPATSATMYLAIVLYTTTNMDSSATADSIILNDISLVPNDFAIASNVMTYDEMFKRCEFYYEKSYAKGVLPGTVTGVGQRIIPTSYFTGATDVMTIRTFSLTYNTTKRLITYPTFYSTTASTPDTIGQAITSIAGGSVNTNFAISGNWTIGGNSEQSVTLAAASGNNVQKGANANDQTYVFFQYTVDARLGYGY